MIKMKSNTLDRILILYAVTFTLMAMIFAVAIAIF